MKFFRPQNFFLLLEQFQKLVAFLQPIFRNVDGSWRVTSKLRGSTLIQVAQRRLNVFQRFSASLVRVGDVKYVSRRHAVRGKKEPHFLIYCRGSFGEGVEKVEKFIELLIFFSSYTAGQISSNHHERPQSRASPTHPD